MKPRTQNSVADIAKFVAAGHAQSAANCRVLLDEIERLREMVNQAAAAGYRACAETRHVSLGTKVAAAVRCVTRPNQRDDWRFYDGDDCARCQNSGGAAAMDPCPDCGRLG